MESVNTESLLDAVRIPTLRGCPRRRPTYLLADRAYGVDRIRRYLRQRGIKAVIPNKAIPKGRKRRKRGPKPKVDPVLYAKRNVIYVFESSEDVAASKSIMFMPSR